jgi:hypothetical protein
MPTLRLVVALRPILALNSHSLWHRKEYPMDGANGAKETTLSVNVFTAPGKAMTELYPHWVANQSWLIFGFPGA